MGVEKEGFASRWSRRKQEVSQEADIVDVAALEEEIIINEETLSEKRLEKLNALTDEDMPSIETLDEDSDFSGFMSSGVSEALRKMALQKLFHGKSYNLRDGLDEYDGDYTSFEKLNPSVITCDMKHILDVEAEKLLAEEKVNEELSSSDVVVDADKNEEIEIEVDNESDEEAEDFAITDREKSDNNNMESDFNEREENEGEADGENV